VREGGRVSGASGRRGLPSPFVRLWRQPLRVGAIALLAVTALAASGIQSAAAMVLQATLDENWRGTYDILVTPTDALGEMDGLLPPNSLGSSAAGMTLEELAAVRAVDGVEVAAPLGEILVPSLKFPQARVAIPRGFVGAGEAPQGYRITATYTTDDGLGERIVDQRAVSIVVDEASELRPPSPPPQCGSGGSYSFGGTHGDYEADFDLYPALKAMACGPIASGDGVTVYEGGPGGGSWSWSGDDGRSEPAPVLGFQLPAAPQTLTRITLVDPEAERTLLGGVGAFLDPLIAVRPTAETTTATLEDWANMDGGPFARRFLDHISRAAVWTSDYGAAEVAELRALFAANDDDWDSYVRDLLKGTIYAPLLVASQSPAALALKIDVEAYGPVGVEMMAGGEVRYLPPDAMMAGEDGVVVGSAAGDVSTLLNPFYAAAPALAWPGASLDTAEALPTYDLLNIFAVGEVSAARIATDGDGVVITPDGYHVPILDDGLPQAAFGLRPTGEQTGAEAAYASGTQIWSIDATGSSIAAAAVGAFDAAAIEQDEYAADYVPLGAYAPVGSTLTRGEHAGTTMLPSLAGLGLVSPRTVAIGSIHSAPLWGDDAPIASIRVRVAGVDGYNAAGQRKVVDVAEAIEQLGFQATIVAGSSPTDTTLRVDAYAFGTAEASVAQEVGELGTVLQRWSELGAASRVSLSVSSATLAILGIALAAGILLLGAVQLAGIPGRREQAVVMREVGFTRKLIARWFAAEEIPGLLVVALVGAVAWWISRGSGIATVAAAAAVAAVLVTGMTSVVVGSRVRAATVPRDARSRRLGARSVPAFGARQAVIHPLTTLVHVLAIVIVGLSAAGLAAATLAGREGAGVSSLALLAIAQQLGPQLALGAAGVVGGILLARLTRGLDLARRADQWATLRAAGWTSGQLATAQRVEGVTVALPGLALTAGLAWFGAQWLELASVWLYLVVAVGAGLATALVAFSTRRKGSA